MWDLVTGRGQWPSWDERRNAKANHETICSLPLLHSVPPSGCFTCKNLYPKDAKSHKLSWNRRKFCICSTQCQNAMLSLGVGHNSFSSLLLHLLLSLNNTSVILKLSFWASCSSKPTFYNWPFQDSIFSSALERTETLLVERAVSTLKNINKMSPKQLIELIFNSPTVPFSRTKCCSCNVFASGKFGLKWITI